MRVLVVEDDDLLRRSIGKAVSSWGAQAIEAATVAEGVVFLAQHPDLLVVDVRLGEGSGIDVVRAATQVRPIPLMIAMSGKASPEEAFRLAQLGVRGYLPKPLSLDDLRATVTAIAQQQVSLSAHAAGRVGQEAFQDVQANLRRTMVEQALALSAGSRTGAARLLGVTRQAVQQMIRDLSLEKS
ncbi:MAG TPA: response regulator [Polyangiaceae bacterium]|nr:response regulator [Polyangiaceae bacterium]